MKKRPLLGLLALAGLVVGGSAPPARAQSPAAATVCCGMKPAFPAIAGAGGNYPAIFTGQVAVATSYALTPGDTELEIIDLKNQAAAPIDTNWSSTTPAPPYTAFYRHPSWSQAQIGDVMGLTLDSSGNIYVAATTSYGGNHIGSVGAGRGGVYKIATGTALPSVFIGTENLPMWSGNVNKLPNTGPGLGNINYDCQHNVFYVSNFEDGFIYRLSPAGTVLSRWDHGNNLPSASQEPNVGPPSVTEPAMPDPPSAQWTPLGRRVWAVQAIGNRLYYSVEWEDQGRPDATRSNEIWSVQLDGAGDFIGKTNRLELRVPPLFGNNFSNPVADISFGPKGTMLLAERSMYGDGSPSAHQSRMLEYAFTSGVGWVPSGNIFEAGKFYNHTNAAGGCDYDFGANGRVWYTGDALHLGYNDALYGLQGAPMIGTTPPGDTQSSILIDLNEDIINQNKTQLGDVEIPCVAPAIRCTADFNATSACAGDPTMFNSFGGTSWSWNFGDPPSGVNNTSNLQNPSHVFSGPGTYNVTLTVTCDDGTSNSITLPVTVQAAAPTPILSGPANTCGGSGMYCVTNPMAGATYSWAVTNGTPSSPTGTCVTITWGGSGPYSITVTGSVNGACPRTAKLDVLPCDVPPVDCCKNFQFDISAPNPVEMAGGVYGFAPTLFANPGPFVKVTADIVSSSVVYSSAACGTNGALNSYITGASPAGVFVPSFATAFPHEAIWSGPPSGAPVSGLAFPFTIQFPNPPAFGCSDKITFCVKFSFTDAKCQTCTVLRCFTFVQKGHKIIWNGNPIGVVANAAIAPLKVVVTDLSCVILHGTTGTVSVVLNQPNTTGTAKLKGTTQTQIVDGVATFSDLSIDTPGTGYTLTATAHVDGDDNDDDTATTAPFNVSLTGNVPIYHTSGSISVDGNVTQAEWNGATPLTLGSAVQDLHPGQWSGSSDYMGAVYTKWDADSLYFAALVRDDVLSFPAGPAGSDPNDLTGRDGLELFLGLREPQTTGRSAYDAGDYLIRVSADAANGKLTARWMSPEAISNFNGPTSNVQILRTSYGYSLEGRIPWSVFNPPTPFDPAAGVTIGFNLQGRDNDQQAFGNDTLMSLTGLANAETDPRAWTTATLVSATGALAGDVNLDGVVDRTDVLLAARIAAGGLADSATAGLSHDNADINHDGKVDAADAVRINRLINGL